jgi:hypothetical protein
MLKRLAQRSVFRKDGRRSRADCAAVQPDPQGCPPACGKYRISSSGHVERDRSGPTRVTRPPRGHVHERSERRGHGAASSCTRGRCTAAVLCQGSRTATCVLDPTTANVPECGFAISGFQFVARSWCFSGHSITSCAPSTNPCLTRNLGEQSVLVFRNAALP